MPPLMPVSGGSARTSLEYNAPSHSWGSASYPRRIHWTFWAEKLRHQTYSWIHPPVVRENTQRTKMFSNTAQTTLNKVRNL